MRGKRKRALTEQDSRSSRRNECYDGVERTRPGKKGERERERAKAAKKPCPKAVAARRRKKQERTGKKKERRVDTPDAKAGRARRRERQRRRKKGGEGGGCSGSHGVSARTAAMFLPAQPRGARGSFGGHLALPPRPAAARPGRATPRSLAAACCRGLLAPSSSPSAPPSFSSPLAVRPRGYGGGGKGGAT